MRETSKDFKFSNMASMILDVAATEEGTQVDLKKLTSFFREEGFLRSHPALTQTFGAIKELLQNGHVVDPAQIENIVKGEGAFLCKKILQRDLAIPDFKRFCSEIKEIYQKTHTNREGRVADYIYQLAKVDPDKYGVSICTVDGQQFCFGDSNEYFSIQSTFKPVSYCMALEELGEETVHQHIGREPSGQSFNEITLDSQGRPHNPMVNAGAIMASSLIRPSATAAERFEMVMKTWKSLSGKDIPIFNNSVYLSEKNSSDRNFALAYFMRERNTFPAGTNILETLDFYFQCCSIDMTCESMAIVAATLAASGVNPLTGRRIFRPEVVKHCLSLMHSCGMYNYSGEFAFSVGLPAKSGVGGGLIVAIPNLMGIGIWSPPLDPQGNSVRGVAFCQELVKRFNFHTYDTLLLDKDERYDPRGFKNTAKVKGAMLLCWAAAQGDLPEVQKLVASGVNPSEGDYDKRTALHLAAAEGNLEVVKFLIGRGVCSDIQDRWGRTPLHEAQRSNHTTVTAFLENQKASPANVQNQKTFSHSPAV